MITILALGGLALLYVVRWRRRLRRSNRPASSRPVRRRGRLGALFAVAAILGLHTFTGTPAMAQEDVSCAPYPQRPGTGMVGAIDPPEGNGLAGSPRANPPYSDVPYTSKEYPASPYMDHSYAGLVWHVYDPECEDALSITDPSTTIDTWAGNQLFNVGKNIVGLTNSLHYTLQEGGVLGGLTDQIADAAGAIFDNIYMQLFSVFMVVLAVLMFRQIWRGDLATVSKRALFALGGMWLAASTLVLVNNYPTIDKLIVDTTTGISNGFTNPEDDRVQRDVLPTELHNRVVYENWLRGEFGSPNDPEAREYGRDLLAAQAWTYVDVRDGRDGDDVLEQQKRGQYIEIYNSLGRAQGYFTGEEGSRTGAGFLGLFQAVVYGLFQFLAKLAVLLAQLLLRILTLAAPVIGLVALLHHDILRRVGRAAGAVVLNVLVLAMLAGVHARFLQMIFSEGAGLSMLVQMLLAGIVTLIFLLVGRPMRRMWQMIDTSISATGVSVPTGGGLLSRLRRRKGKGQATPQDNFWEQVRESDAAEEDALTASRPRGRRPRPEAAHPVAATAERLDTRRTLGREGDRALPPARPRLDPGFGPDPQLAHAGGPHWRRGGEGMVIDAGSGGVSRVVDTSPVADRGWDRGEDALVVPSRVTPSRGEGGEVYGSRTGAEGPRYQAPAPAAPQPRPAEVEVIAGRPVHVLYRPSRGLEVRDGTPRRMPLHDGRPRDTDAVVR